MAQGVKFIRVRGRVVPIRDDKGAKTKNGGKAQQAKAPAQKRDDRESLNFVTGAHLGSKFGTVAGGVAGLAYAMKTATAASKLGLAGKIAAGALVGSTVGSVAGSAIGMGFGARVGGRMKLPFKKSKQVR